LCQQIGNDNFCDVLDRVRGPQAAKEWRALQEHMRPLASAAAMLPPAAMRADPGVLLTAVARYLPALLANGANAAQLTGPFSKVCRVPQQQGTSVCSLTGVWVLLELAGYVNLSQIAH
jgi:hypothetical protein